MVASRTRFTATRPLGGSRYTSKKKKSREHGCWTPLTHLLGGGGDGTAERSKAVAPQQDSRIAGKD